MVDSPEMKTALAAVVVLLLAGILIEQYSWHRRQEALRLAQAAAEQDQARARKFLDEVDAFKMNTELHAAEIYGCQNGMRESDKYIWVRWQKVDPQIRALGNRADLVSYLHDPAQEQNAYELVRMGNELIYEAQQAGGPILRDTPAWMRERAEWMVTPEELAKF
jgi:hypothetical protein